jgi:ketosteroid isomerase-like protein
MQTRMIKRILPPVFSFICISMAADAQRPVDGLVQAEKNFAAYSVSHSTKEAFLEFLDSSGVVFEKGLAVNGFEAWNKREKRSSVLDWQPAFAGISVSGDLGFTNGPWTFKPSPKDTVVARGQYSTVWHRDKNGQWKFLVDLGISNGSSPATSVTVLNPSKTYTAGNAQSLLEAENNFITASMVSPEKAYKKFLSHDAVINRNDRMPQQAHWDKDIFRGGVKYTVVGSGISSAGDLGYVYGNTVIDGKNENYLRVWRRNGNEWNIVLEVLRY